MSKQHYTYRYLTWEYIEQDCLSIYANMKKDKYVPDVILGLLRGGVVPSRIFLDLYHTFLDFCYIDVKLYDGIGTTIGEPKIRSFVGDIKDKKILIVDDIWDSGKTMKAVLEHLKGYNITTATLYWKSRPDDFSIPQGPDYFSKMVKEGEWLVFPWEKYEFWRLIDNDNNR